jgi:hypothetical protein
MGSHDLEDFVAVIDGRSTIVVEIAQAPLDLRQYLAEAARRLLQEPRFLEVLPGFVYGDAASQQRVPLIEQRLEAMSRLT